jgi:flagellar basal-body rod modification protein FlgD
MTTTTAAAGSSADIYAGLNGSAAASNVTANDAGSADRFLKLLVAQMQNQDPLDPMDNAQVTSQMAQINTVDGISRLHKTVQALSAQFVQLQALQGASLVGREVTLEGNRLAVADGQGEGAFELASAADHVKLEVLGPAGHVIDTLDLGAMGAGRHRFDWPAGTRGDDEGLKFRVTATSGAVAVATTPLMLDRVVAVSAGGDELMLELERSGEQPWSALKTFN